jgi:3-dehydroquinate dehydratase/shikimate dehydrogenase
VQVAEEFIKKTMGTKKATIHTKIIVSNHNWECTPSKEAIGSSLEQMQSTGADILKFVTTAQDITDASRVFCSLSTLQASP